VQLNEQILLRCPALREPFYPTPLLAGAHAQTVVAAVRGLGTFPLLDLDRQLVTTHTRAPTRPSGVCDG